jgi:aminopeptidase-like protein
VEGGDDPDLVPYRTSYYAERWGFCMSTRQLEPTEYYVRVRARTRPRVNWLLFWPWDHGAPTGEARFTLIQ